MSATEVPIPSRPVLPSSDNIDYGINLEILSRSFLGREVVCAPSHVHRPDSVFSWSRPFDEGVEVRASVTLRL